MTPVTTFAGRTVALFGLGGSGLATALALKAGGAELLAWDDSEASLDQARAQGIGTADMRTADWSRFAALVLSPGVPLTHPEPHWSAKLAHTAGVEIIGDIELFCRERAKIAPDAPLVAITGTNGKSTTTALVSHILREAGRDVQMGGNIGTAILSLMPPAQNRVHVIEMSSFQIDLTPSMNPTIGVLLNLSPDHLDRHGTMENYAGIKERLVAGAATSVIGIDDVLSLSIASEHARLGQAVVQVTAETELDAGIVAEKGVIARLNGAARQPIADLSGIGSLRGTHNAQNAAAAVAVALELGIETETIARALRNFPGLPHRMEEVARLGRALFINDSKATNADSTEKALASFDRIHWIAGGLAKEGGIERLRPYFGKIAKAYLIGAASDAFAATLEGVVPFERCETLDVAVPRAAEDAAASDVPEPVVLLSPACASYDQFKNFELRGNRFRDLVRALPQPVVKGV